MKKSVNKILLITLYCLTFTVANAQVLTSEPLGGTDRFFTNALSLVSNILVPLAFAAAMLFFFWGVAKYIRSEGEGKDDGKRIMVWGVVALFVMSSVWGLVFFLRREFGIRDVGNYQTVPNINLDGSASSGGGETPLLLGDI